MLATIELDADDIRTALELLCDSRDLGELMAFEVIPAPEPDPPYAAREKPKIRARVEVTARQPAPPPAPVEWNRERSASMRSMEPPATWIPVTAAHPRVGETVLIWREGQDPVVSTRDAHGWTGRAGQVPSHWIPIPIVDPWERCSTPDRSVP